MYKRQPDCYEHDSEHDLKRFFINDDRISYLDGKYQVDPKALKRAEHAREELEETKKELKNELESYGPKGPSWDFVTFYEELCRRFLKGRIEEPYGTNLLASSESLTFYPGTMATWFVVRSTPHQGFSKDLMVQ